MAAERKGEDKYFFDLEQKRLLKERQVQAEKMEKEKKQKQKELHFMRCPKCGSELSEVPYADIHIDICPSCEGVWLDAGEMDKIQSLKKGFFSSIRNIFE